MSDAGKKPKRENGKLRIPLPFEEAIKAALETQPKKRKKRKQAR